jgi:DNA-binding IclR family transcriptional regulator
VSELLTMLAVPPSAHDAGGVLTLRRGLSILDAFGTQPGAALGVNEIARRVNMHKSSVSRLCATLEQAGYLDRVTASGKFQLGRHIYQLVGALSTAPDLRAVARPILQQVVDVTGETAHLAAFGNSELITIEVVEGHHLMRMQGRVGHHQLFHASALGLAILARLPPAQVDELLGKRPLARLTPNTVTDRRQLRQRLGEIRAAGYSVDFEGVEDGLRCVGAVVLDQGGSVVGAISVSGPRHRLSPEVIGTLGAQVRDAAAGISLRLGAPATAVRGLAASPLTRQAAHS